MFLQECVKSLGYFFFLMTLITINLLIALDCDIISLMFLIKTFTLSEHV